MIWQIPNMWKDGECWIIGGGPSMPRQFDVPEDVISGVLKGELQPEAYSPYLSRIHGKHVIAVNAAFTIGEWMDIVFFGDGNFYRKNRSELIKYSNLKVTCNPKLKGKIGKDRVKHVPHDKQHPVGITHRANRVSWNGNTGAAAINLAYHLGVRRIVLLGFDMHREGQAQHWHTHYRPLDQALKEKSLPFHRHLRGFPQIAKDAKRLGVEILNVSPNSAIKELKKVTLKDVL